MTVYDWLWVLVGIAGLVLGLLLTRIDFDDQYEFIPGADL